MNHTNYFYFIQTIGSMKPEDIVMNAFKKLLEKISSIQMGLNANDVPINGREPARDVFQEFNYLHGLFVNFNILRFIQLDTCNIMK